MEYLEKCDMLDGVDPEEVREIMTTFHGTLFESLTGYNSDTLCFESFPFWEAQQKAVMPTEP